ncbi:MAG: Sbal_3080 family lipoprotein [Gammaproteobacteria bacterium]|jgi:hypothetical protein|nr:Sbal_3080 family lipoprotein [Gammaproteobacteria bacterium]MDH3751661.1 Sbal_3080 family lipoprotein [Gammaproteobacteria bacterium]MDH3805823.1 Sbal_3080 family lipoprotein [Gammaproteobacteria bacterium]
MLRIVVLALSLLICACTSVKVQPVDASMPLLHVCIQRNTAVQVGDFLQVLEDGFERHGIGTEIYNGNRPRRCEYVLTYTALRSWDMKPYLSHAELRLLRAGQQVASADYHLRGKGGFSLTKWAGTKSKMDPVIDELLAGT